MPKILRLKELKENPLNRDINRDKVAEIKRAIIRTGQIKPLVYTEIMTDDGKENMLTDGHHRYVALREMGYKRVPAVMADERGIDTANKAKPEKVKKHLPGQHDQKTHTPKTRRAREAVAGTAEAGAIHLATVAIPAAVVGTLLRIAPRIGLGAIGITAAFLLYEVPQLIFRMVEGGYRGYSGERPYRILDQKKMMKVGNRDVAGRTISRGDHVLVMYQDNANVGVHLGGDVTRILNGEKLVDVETNETNRMKISTGEDVPNARPEDAEKTKKILNRLIQEQKILLNLAHNLQQRQKVTKHTPGGQQHNQQSHAGGQGREKPDISVETPDIATPEKLKTFQGVKDYLSQGTKIILSAEKDDLTPDENRRRTVGLKRILQNLSSDIVTQSWHEGDNPIERSFIATPNDKEALDEIVNLAFDPNELNQESIIVIRNGVAEARYGDKRSSLYTTVNKTREVPSAKGYYSQLGSVRYVFDFKPSPKTQTEKLVRAVEKMRDLAASLNRVNKVGIIAAPVQGLGLTREDLGIRRKKKQRSEKGWMTGRTIQLRRPVKNPEGHELEGSRFP